MSECDFCSVSSKLNFFVSSFIAASIARFDGMVETSMTFFTCVVYNIWCLGTFESKAITQCRSVIFVQVEFLCVFIPLSIQCNV